MSWLVRREFEKAQGTRNELLPADAKKSKERTLADAGFPTSTAQRYEQLPGPRKQQTQPKRASSEIKLRAVIKNGGLSRELAKNERARTDLHPDDRKQTKRNL
jgi:hypothetical protein